MTVAAGANGLLLLNIDGALGNAAATGRMTIGGTLISSATATVRTGDSKMVVPFTAPVVAGTYTASVQVSVGGTYSGTGADTFTQAFTLTVTAATTLSTSLSTAYMTAPTAVGALASSTTNAVARSAYKTADTAIAQVKVTLLKADGTADLAAHSINTIVSGVGFTAVSAGVDTPGAAKTRSASYAQTGGSNLSYVKINSDGTAGTGTVTVSVTHAVTAVETTLGTFSYTSYGDVATLAVSTTNFTVGKSR
jgi:hypothetical protein